MKKTSIKILSIVLIFILTMSILCSCNAGNESAMSPDYGGNYEDGSTIGSKGEGSGTVETERKLIKTVSINAQTKEFDKTTDYISNKCKELGGYIESSSISGNSVDAARRSRYASFTLRIPADKLDQFTADVENSVNVTSLSSNVQEITDAYYDAVARLEVLEAQRTSLQSMLEQAKTVSEILSIQDRLYDVIEEIESYKARINKYDNKVAYSTVTISLYEVVEYTPVTPSFGSRIVEAFKISWTNFWNFCQNFTIVFVRAIPTLLLLGTIAFIIVVIIKGSIKRARKKRAARRAAQQAENK